MYEPTMESGEWFVYVHDMMEFCRRIQDYTADLTFGEYMGNDLVQDAAKRNLMVLGEAARRIPAEVRAAHPEIAWQQIIALRNRLAHNYDDTREEIIWDIIRKDIPALPPKLHRLLEAYGGAPTP